MPSNITNEEKVSAPWPVSFSHEEAKFMYAFDRYLLGTTRISVGGNMETLDALCKLYGDVSVLQVHYHLEMFRP